MHLQKRKTLAIVALIIAIVTGSLDGIGIVEVQLLQ
jgi:hypothetical protein